MTLPTKKQLDESQQMPTGWIEWVAKKNPMAAILIIAVVIQYADQRINTGKLIILVESNIEVNTRLKDEMSKSHDRVDAMKSTITEMNASLIAIKSLMQTTRN